MTNTKREKARNHATTATTKNGLSWRLLHRKIPLNATAKDVLLNHETPFPQSPYVFPNSQGKQRTDMKRPINRIKERADLPDDFRPLHGLRHVYASMLASSGKVDLYTLQRVLTHKSPKMTERYAHLRHEALQRGAKAAVDVIGDALNHQKSSREIQGQPRD